MAIAVSSELQVTFLFVALSGLTVTPSVVVSSILIAPPQLVISTDVTSIAADFTVTVQYAFSLLSPALAQILVEPTALAVILPFAA